MPKERVTHYNPPDVNNKTRCGEKLDKVKWAPNKDDVTCNRCLRLIARDVVVNG